MTITPITTEQELREEIARLAAEVAECRGAIHALAESLRTEVRTRKVVVVDDQDIERIETFTTDHATELLLSYPNPADVQVAVGVSAENTERTAGYITVSGTDSIRGNEDLLSFSGTVTGLNPDDSAGQGLVELRRDDDIIDLGALASTAHHAIHELSLCCTMAGAVFTAGADKHVSRPVARR